MTRYEVLSLRVQVVGYFLVVLSLLVTWLQLHQLSEQNRLLVHTQREGPTLARDRVFIEYPEIRPYFYGGVDIDEKDPLYNKVVAVAEMHLDVFDYKLKYKQEVLGHQPFTETDRIWAGDMFRSSPILRKY